MHNASYARRESCSVTRLPFVNRDFRAASVFPLRETSPQARRSTTKPTNTTHEVPTGPTPNLDAAPPAPSHVTALEPEPVPEPCEGQSYIDTLAPARSYEDAVHGYRPEPKEKRRKLTKRAPQLSLDERIEQRSVRIASPIIGRYVREILEIDSALGAYRDLEVRRMLSRDDAMCDGHFLRQRLERGDISMRWLRDQVRDRLVRQMNDLIANGSWAEEDSANGYRVRIVHGRHRWVFLLCARYGNVVTFFSAADYARSMSHRRARRVGYLYRRRFS